MTAATLALAACVTPSGPPRVDPGSQSAPHRAADGPPPAFGVTFHGTWEMYYTGGNSAQPNAMFGRHLDQLAAAGVEVLRVDVGWSASQPTPSPPSLSWRYNQRVARVLREAAARGMRVVVTLHQSPAWARPGTGARVRQYPTDPAAIVGWATWMARTFGRQVAGWEVWNEPNIEAFTAVRDVAARPARYVALLRAVHRGLKAGDRQAVVVFGGPVGHDDVFLRACYALGARPYFDVLAVHPYQGDQRVPPESDDVAERGRMTHFPAVLAVMAEYGDAAKPVWWTEFGFSVHSNEGVSRSYRRGVPDPGTAADYLRRAFELVRTRYPQVTLAVVYVAYKPPTDAPGHQHGYRLLEADGRARPQLTVLRDYHGRFAGERPLR